MFRLGREKYFALAALFLLLLGVAIAPAAALKARSDALQALSDEEDSLRRLTAATHRVSDKTSNPGQSIEAPKEAFLNAQTSGLAVAQLESYVSEIARASRANLVSTNAQPAEQSDASDIVRVQVNIDADYETLQPLLYKLEAGTPYVFVDSLKLRPEISSTTRVARGSPMKVVLGLKAIWRQSAT